MAVLIEGRIESPVDRDAPLPNGDFRRSIKIRDHLGTFTVKVLDEQLLWNKGGTAHVRQFLLGQHDRGGKWRRHWGWQGLESIREIYRMNIGGTVVTREIDVSEKEYVFS